jgi:uncharacterized protein
MPARSRVVRDAQPDEEGRLDGLAYALLRPAREPLGAVVVLHGAGSRKESHLGFARAAAATGLLAVVLDARGHGASDGPMDGRAVEDVLAVCALARERAGGAPVALRGSSMGGWAAIAAAGPAGAAACVAICPAPSDGLRRGLRAGRYGFAADVAAVDALLAATNPRDLVADLGERLLLLHARGDEVVPVEVSEELHALAPGSRLVAVPGGHHRSAQHDPELEALSLRFLRRRLREATATATTNPDRDG